MAKKIEMWGTQFWLIAIAVFVVATLFGYYVVPSIGVAVDPMASSNVINGMHADYGSHQCAIGQDQSECIGSAGTVEQWMGDAMYRCDTQFNNNARQLGMCYTKIYDEMFPY